MPKVVMYSSENCPFCTQAQQLLRSKAVEFEVISVDGQPEVRQQMAAKAGRTSVPQIWIGDHHIGGCNDLCAYNDDGRLDKLLRE
ncbi:MAG: glutaredoxin 3 [Kistimonas sp.]|nr:glutaredoxin 3 [Kistimonas sp.]